MRFGGGPVGADRGREKTVEELAALLVEAARAAFTQAREAHPGETFYCYGLYTGPLLEYILPTCGSEEGLRAVARVYAAEFGGLVEARIGGLRWSPADSPHHLLGEHHFDAVEELLASRDADADTGADVEDEAEARLEACFRALARLDREGFFGRGDERERVIVTVLQGDQSDRSRLANARRLNPPAAVARLAREMLVREPSEDATMLGSMGTYQVTALAFAAEAGLLVACGSGGEVFAWEAADGREVLAVRHYASYWRAAISADARTLVLRDGGSPVRVALPGGIGRGAGFDDAWDVAVSPDGTVTAAAGETVRAFEAGRERWRLERPASAVRFSGDGALLAVVGDGREKGVAVLDAADGSVVAELVRSGPEVRYHVAWSADGRLLAVGDPASVRLWHRDGRVFAEGRAIAFRADTGRPADLAFSPNGTVLATAHADGDVHVWEVATGRHVRRLRGPQEAMNAVVWLDDARLAAAGRDVDAGPPVHVFRVRTPGASQS
ncbi:DUF4303 domain-containing protein [Actinomadura algeriensis]|uniref:Anaphase-promoting complex subunit 4-like WD40 domain-containing protein n=1 Tax=Actinomadura algeriensis TaxID=1679523 RepID=A0ABR9JN70_9ACTN|nr:DUF4303 domain-containing protein [Actinomadura algeriensis]MBE1532013.1 hypothetical protein [Actinomadura algeriensis]